MNHLLERGRIVVHRKRGIYDAEESTDRASAAFTDKRIVVLGGSPASLAVGTAGCGSRRTGQSLRLAMRIGLNKRRTLDGKRKGTA